MKTIEVNGAKVQVSNETIKRIEKIAAAKKLSFDAAVSYCLEKVI